MDLTAWLRRYLTSHPLKDPEGIDRSQYTAEVMARVREAVLPATQSAPRRWAAWPQFAVAAVAATAVVLLVVGRAPDTQLSVVQEVEEEINLLAAIDETSVDLLEEADLAAELDTLDTLILAEATPSDETWVLETLLLLEEVGEEAPGASVDDDQWLQDLELLDELEISASS